MSKNSPHKYFEYGPIVSSKGTLEFCQCYNFETLNWKIIKEDIKKGQYVISSTN
jgi:hypothetical protein